MAVEFGDTDHQPWVQIRMKVSSSDADRPFYIFQELSRPFFLNIHLATEKFLFENSQNGQGLFQCYQVSFVDAVGLTQWANDFTIIRKGEDIFAKIRLVTSDDDQAKYLVITAQGEYSIVDDENRVIESIESMADLQKYGLEVAALATNNDESLLTVKVDGTLILLKMGYKIQQEVLNRMLVNAENPRPITDNFFRIYWPDQDDQRFNLQDSAIN
ncbi:MAG: hypothetical protein QHH09_00110 [Microgenomates group bacterium]|nr:hypothetical protein [Microgenomates group bacterium]